jgi:hypothetical protein
MERVHEETANAQESPRGGAWPVRRAGAERGQAARQSGERAQGRPGQKPQEDARRAAQCQAASARTSQEVLKNLILMIQVLFGQVAIGLGESGLRYRGVAVR